jgi:uncharacterized SAM-binding protein YcdF (DUF218 family)
MTRFCLLVLFVLLPGLALLGFFTAGAALSFSAKLPHRADVVVVLGGGGGARYTRGAELVKAGFSKQLVLIESIDAKRKDVLANVPGVVFWDDVSPHNTWGEAHTTQARMRAMGWKSVLVVSDPPHMLRMRYAWGAAFRGSDLSYTLVATNPPWWSTWRWWTHPRAARFVKSEVLKLGYYVVHYRFGLI